MLSQKESGRTMSNRLADLHTYVLANRMPFKTDLEVDQALVGLFNQKFLEGEGSHYGDYVCAALTDRVPEFGKFGSRKIPRAWRCLR